MEKRKGKILIVAILSILMLSVPIETTSTNAGDNPKISDVESNNSLKKDNPPANDIPLQEISMAVEQVTYTDMWLRSNTTFIETASMNWVDVPGMSISINVKYPSDLLIMFSAEAATMSFNGGIVRALVDSNVAQPGSTYLISRSVNYQSQSYNFQKINVPAGSHRIDIQWKSDMPYSNAFVMIKNRSLSVLANGAGHPP